MQHGLFISLAEAVALTGVSASTLSKFAEAGYFGTRPILGTENEFELDRGEICTLFKIIEKPSAKSVASEAADTIFSTKNTASSMAKTEEVKNTPESLSSGASLVDSIEVSGSVDISDPEPAPSVPNRATDTKVINAGGAEIRRLRALCELHEKYIEFKESQVTSLTEERNWLRTRIEKLEEKAERDQVIFASLSETQRGLVAQIAHKKTALQAALEWIGVTQPEPQRDDSRP